MGRAASRDIATIGHDEPLGSFPQRLAVYMEMVKTQSEDVSDMNRPGIGSNS
jgi:hypothetical protein